MTLVRHRSTEPYEQSDCRTTIRNSDKSEVRIIDPYNITEPIDQNNATSLRTNLNNANTQIVVGNLKGVDGHNVNNIYSEEGIAPTVRDNHGKITPVKLSEPYIHNVPHGFNNGFDKPYPNLRSESSSQHNEILIIPNDDLQIRDGRYNRSTLRSGRTSEIGFPGSSIRRLTEVECERLQGFKDGHTQFGDYDGVIKKIPKSQRYKLLGNAVTVDIVELVTKRLLVNE